MSLHDELVSEVRRFAMSALDDARTEREGVISQTIVSKMREMGLFGLTISEEYGGLGLPLGVACELVAELARRDRSVATMVGLHAGLGTHAVSQHGTDELRAAWLPRLARGELIGSFCATEADAGSDIASVRTTAVLDGSDVVVNGEKSYVTNARYAGCFTVLARWGTRSHALVLVPRETKGTSIGVEEHKLGIRASSTATVVFDDVRIPANHVLGKPGAGLELAHDALARGRTLMSAGCLGTAHAALARTIEHVTMRRQFRRTLGEFPAVRRRVTELAATVHAMEALVAIAAKTLDDDDTIAVKVFASEGAFEVADAAVQLHGALGFMEDAGVCRLLRDCRVTRIFEGANDVLLVRLAMSRLSANRTAKRVDHEACDALAERLDHAFEHARTHYGATVVQHQSLLQALARADIAHRAAVSSLGDRTSTATNVADFAAQHWAERGMTAIDALARDDAAERRALLISDLIYGIARPCAAE